MRAISTPKTGRTAQWETGVVTTYDQERGGICIIEDKFAALPEQVLQENHSVIEKRCREGVPATSQ